MVFFGVLSDCFRDSYGYESTIGMGDLNLRVHRQCPGEEFVIGNYAFGNVYAELDFQLNRS